MIILLFMLQIGVSLGCIILYTTNMLSVLKNTETPTIYDAIGVVFGSVSFTSFFVMNWIYFLAWIRP